MKLSACKALSHYYYDDASMTKVILAMQADHALFESQSLIDDKEFFGPKSIKKFSLWMMMKMKISPQMLQFALHGFGGRMQGSCLCSQSFGP